MLYFVLLGCICDYILSVSCLSVCLCLVKLMYILLMKSLQLASVSMLCIFVLLLYPRREAGILWIHHRRRPRPRPRPRPQRFLVSDLQSTFLSGFLSYLAGDLIW